MLRLIVITLQEGRVSDRIRRVVPLLQRLRRVPLREYSRGKLLMYYLWLLIGLVRLFLLGHYPAHANFQITVAAVRLLLLLLQGGLLRPELGEHRAALCLR